MPDPGTSFQDGIWGRLPRLRLEVENHLRQTTINQLFSVINQNLTWSGVGDVHEPSDLHLFLEYVDSVIDCRTPIFQLLDHNDKSYLPAQALVGVLKAYGSACSTPECEWHILVPRMLTSGMTGIFPADLLSRFSLTAGMDLLTKRPDELAECSRDWNRELELVVLDGAPWIRYRKQALVRAFQTKHYALRGQIEVKTVRLATHPISLLCNRKLCRCDWPPHLGDVAVIRHTSSDA